MHRSLRAFRSRNYRLWFFGQALSLMGTWMTQTALLWLVYDLSGSAWILGMAGFATNAPAFLLAPFGGILADRFDRKRLLIITQWLSMAQSLSLALLVGLGLETIPLLLLLGAFQGIVNAFDLPVRQALVVSLVEEREDLGNAIALNSSMFNLARLLGPAAAGLLIAAGGPFLCFLIDGLSYIPVLVSIAAMRLGPLSKPSSAFLASGVFASLREGVVYAWTTGPLRGILLLLMSVSFFGFGAMVLVPVFAVEIFGGDSRTLGFLMSASGCGALCAALYLSTRSGLRGLGRVIVIGGFLIASGQVALAFSGSFALALPCLFATGIGGVLMMASGNTVIQTLVDNEKRGRVMSLFMMSFAGMMPLGNLAAGWLAGWVGPAMTVLFSGGMCAAVTVIFLYHLPLLRDSALKMDHPELRPQ